MTTPKKTTEIEFTNSADAIAQQQREAGPIYPKDLHRKKGEDWLYTAENQPQMTEKLALIQASIIDLLDGYLSDESLPHVVEKRAKGEGVVLFRGPNNVTDTVKFARSTETGSVMAEKVDYVATTKEGTPVDGYSSRSASIIDGDVAVRIYEGDGDSHGTSNLLKTTSIAVFRLNADADPNVFHGGKANAITLDQIKNSKDANFVTVDRYGWHDDESYATSSLKENVDSSVDAIISALGKLKTEVPA